MSITIFMYAEMHLNGVWKSCYPVETCEEDGKVSYSMETVFSNDEREGSYPLSRMLLDFDRIRHHTPETSALPRGLPDDLSPELRQFVSWQEENGRFLHYPSWLLLRELLELPWDERKATITEFVNAEQYVIFKRKRHPEQFISPGFGECSRYSRGSSIADWVLSFFRKPSPPDRGPKIVSNEEMEQIVAGGNLSSEVITRLTVLDRSYAENCQVFLQHTVPLLKTFGASDKVRIVFWF